MPHRECNFFLNLVAKSVSCFTDNTSILMYELGINICPNMIFLSLLKTYPEISKKHTETVCTAGIDAKTRKLIRLYPIRFRYLEGEQKFRKYQWIRVHIKKALSDPRPESHHIDSGSIEVCDIQKSWEERYSWLINENTVFSSVEALRSAQRIDRTSLGMVKPKSVKRVIFQRRNEKEVQDAINKKNGVINQLDMFEEKKDLYILPIRIMIEFYCDDPSCSGHNMTILDWEFAQLYRKLANRADWQEKIESKIIGGIFGEKRDTYVILGNMANHPQTFCILGFFWPPKVHSRQLSLFG